MWKTIRNALSLLLLIIIAFWMLTFILNERDRKLDMQKTLDEADEVGREAQETLREHKEWKRDWDAANKRMEEIRKDQVNE